MLVKFFQEWVDMSILCKILAFLDGPMHLTKTTSIDFIVIYIRLFIGTP